MTKISPLWLALAPLLAAPCARAADESFCADLPALAANVKDCQQNVFFVKAADACEMKLQKEIDTQQTILAAAMLLTNTATTSSQTARIQNSNADLAQMQATLADLEAKARTARAEMVLYSQNFLLAGPMSQAFAKKIHLDRLLNKFPCFANNQKFLGETVKDVDTQIAQLDKASQGATKLAIANKGNLKKMDATSLNGPVVTGTDKSHIANVPTGSSTRTPSSITGTEKAGQDEKALQQLTAPKK